MAVTKSVKPIHLLLDQEKEEIQQLPEDGWLKIHHILLFMDDTALIATNREVMQTKLETLYRTVREINMKVHARKSKYIVVNVNSDDNLPLTVNRVSIHRIEKYTYVGSLTTPEKLTKQIYKELQVRVRHIHM